jgi:rhamnulokinase
MNTYAAVDIGASNGRVMLGSVTASAIELTQAYRFANEPVDLPDGLHWDILRLLRETLTGLRIAVRDGAPVSAGIDSWAVDYGLIDASGALLGLPYHYRDARTNDARTNGVDDYRSTGIAHLAFNTVNQLRAEPAYRLDAARTFLLIPDLLGYCLTGQMGAERTNASTTALYDVGRGEWATDLIDRAGLPRRLFPPLREPGSPIGPMLPPTGLDLPLVAVGSHDTASAVVAVPARNERFAYISCGTWSLVGVELTAPILTRASQSAGFTNEVGVDQTIRYLRNVMGLWLLQECQRAWDEPDTAALLAAAADARPRAALINPDDPIFLPRGDMPARIADYCRRTGQTVPTDQATIVRCVLESLAIAHRATVREAARLTGRTVEVIHLVGGGARNALLCQLTADACGLPVVAGPVEATALGNILVQARADGGPATLAEMRALIADTQVLRRYQPRGESTAWDRAAARIGRG